MAQLMTLIRNSYLPSVAEYLKEVAAVGLVVVLEAAAPLQVLHQAVKALHLRRRHRLQRAPPHPRVLLLTAPLLPPPIAHPLRHPLRPQATPTLSQRTPIMALSHPPGPLQPQLPRIIAHHTLTITQEDITTHHGSTFTLRLYS